MDSKLFAHIKRSQQEDRRRLLWWRITVLALFASLFIAGFAAGRLFV
jgi:hypothetical protein